MKTILHFIIVLLVFTVGSVNAQVNNYLFTQSLSTYSPITGTVVDSLNEDDVFHPNIPIGFTFNYNGNITDRIGICTNGFIVMDSFNHSALWTPTNGTINQINLLMTDLKNLNPTGRIEYTLQGTAPNRVFIVQWKEYSITGIALCRLNAQIRLYEGSNCIKLCYGTNLLSGNAGKIFSVGLVGNNMLDYNLRTTNTNWIKSNKSTSYPGPGMLFNPLVNLPSGLEYSFGACNISGVPYYYIRGSVFKDVNNNGIRDGGELGMPNISVYDSLNNEYTNTDINGDYTIPFHDSLQFYRIKVAPPAYWSVSSTPASYTLYPDTQSVVNRDFGLYALPYKYDIRISATALKPSLAGKKMSMSAVYQNIGTALLPGDTILLLKDSRYSFVNANPTPDYISGDTIAWLYSNLQIDEYRQILVTLNTSNNVATLDTLTSTWMALPLINDTVTSNNIVVLTSYANSSIELNGKSVYPDSLILQGTEVHYTIRFQNTSNGQVYENVFILDTLVSSLDLNSFRLLGATHPVTYSLSGNGILKFTFANINLPDSNTNQEGSHGAVSFSLRPKLGLPENTTVNNKASIYFDFLPAISTNTCSNIVVSQFPTAVQSLAYANVSTVYPNPSSSKVYVHVLQPLGRTQLTLHDAQGRVVMQRNEMLRESTAIDMAHLPAGMYTLSIVWNNGKQVLRLVHQ